MSSADHVDRLLAQAEEWVRPVGDEEPHQTPLVNTIPESSKLMRAVRAELTRLANDPQSTPKMRETVKSVLSGKASLADLMASGQFPVPKESPFPQEVKETIDAVSERDSR